MADGPATQIADVVVPDIWNPYMQNITTEKSNLVRSGVLTISETLNNHLRGGGIVFETPSWKDLDNDEPRVSSDTSVPFDSGWDNTVNGIRRPPNPKKIGSFKVQSVRCNRNQSWSTVDLADQLAGSDPMQAIMSRVGEYWVRQQQKAFISVWNGVVASNIANDNGDMVHDASGGAGAAFSDGVTNFTVENFLAADLTLGDEKNRLSTIFVHSVVYNRMQVNNLIDFIPDARSETMIETFLGRRIIIDDSMPHGTAATQAAGGMDNHVYHTWIFGPGATLYGDVPPPVPVETDRIAGGGNGGGQDVLYSRWQFCIAPMGFSWNVINQAADGGPTNTDFATAANWVRRFPERKQIHFACLITREA